MHFTIAPSDAAPGEFYWLLVDGNNKVVGYSAETYGSEDDTNRALANVLYDLKDRKNFTVVTAAGEQVTPTKFVRRHHRER